MYTILKHLSACLINIDIGLMHHQSLPLVVEKSFDSAPAACSSRARQPHLTQRLQQHIFPTAGLWRCGACKASSVRPGIARHYCLLQVADSTRAFRAVSSAQPPPTCLLFTSAISHVQLPARARDKRVMLPYTAISLVPTWKKWRQNDMKQVWRHPVAAGTGNVEADRRQGTADPQCLDSHSICTVSGMFQNMSTSTLSSLVPLSNIASFVVERCAAHQHSYIWTLELPRRCFPTSNVQQFELVSRVS
jgi:hypothetical protein